MSRRIVHYESAFEDYLHAKGVPCVRVDEAKKAIFGRAKVKSFDFIVYGSAGPNLLVDVKGRKFPDTPPGRSSQSRAWENWVTRDDLEGLLDWQGVFGEGFAGAFVFAYWLQGPPRRSPFEDVHLFRRRHYAFMALGVEEYLSLARPRSRKWQTLSIPSAEFARHARDVMTCL